MDKDYFTNLTIDIYKLTLLFPKKEPLRYKIRELADNILENLIMILDGDEERFEEYIYQINRNIRPLDSFCEVAKKQNWVEESEITDIQEQYEAIKLEIEKFKAENPLEVAKNTNFSEESEGIQKDRGIIRRGAEKRTIDSNEEKLNNYLSPSLVYLNSRQKKIVELLGKKDKMQVNEVQFAFPKITKRTLRRDFNYLSEKGFVEKMGKANMTFYKLADNEI